MEGRDHGGALETAGGIAKALPLLVEHEDDAFWLVSGDIYAPQFRFDDATAARFRAQRGPSPSVAGSPTRHIR